MYSTLYNLIVLPLLLGGLYVLRYFLPKVREGLHGRRELLIRTQRFFAQQRPPRPLLLFHCASAGELEALRPLAAALTEQGHPLALSYFSPSAVHAADAAVEFVFRDYGPVDTKRSVRAYLDAVRPALIAITKHDVWPNFVWEARARHIPVLLINGNFHPKSLRSNVLVRSFNRKLYGSLSAIYAVSEDDTQRARALVQDRTPVTHCGDSRFDRVLTRARQRRPLPESVEQLCRDRFVIVAGSTHEADERILLPAFSSCVRHALNPLLLVVPHDPSPSAKMRIESLAKSSQLTISEDAPADVLLVNRSGVLADLYRVGKLAYVGGAFGQGVHSVLEPMANNLPVLCGPNIGVASEARTGQHLGLVTPVSNRLDVERVLHTWLDAPDELLRLNADIAKFMHDNSGVTRRLTELITAHLPRAAAR